MMVNIKINNQPIQVKKNTTIIQACSKVNIQVPRFCYHPNLSIAGNCRICLVEIKNAPKLAASCAMPVMENMEIYTDSLKVQRAREDVIELLLINHPLDCPICDQGGECDLQDQTMVYGNHRGRFNEYKRTVADKNHGPLINTVMTRCIHCTRCVRFSTELAGIEEMGATGRGNSMEIGTYINKTIHSELSGNMIDLCPVGAITSKPYEFAARPWELENIESIDVFDGLGSNIRVDVRGRDIMRILPKQNKHINQDWISDKIRFTTDGLKNQRIETPMVSLDNTIISNTNWNNALETIKKNTNNNSNIQFIGGSTVDAEALFVFKKLVNQLGSSNITTTNPQISPDFRRNYTFSKNIDDIFNTDSIILLGTNLRSEAPVLNSRLRKISRRKDINIYSIGSSLDLGIKHKQVGNSVKTFIDIVNGNSPICKNLLKSKSISLVIGNSIISSDSSRLVSLATSYLKKYVNISVNVLQPNSNGVSSLDLGYPSVKHNSKYYNKYSNNGNRSSNNNVTYFLGTNNIDLAKDNDFIIYQGHHGYRYTNRHANVLLPGTSFLEKQSLFVNTEGRVQETRVVLSKLNNSIQDWKILQGISQWLSLDINSNSSFVSYNGIQDIRTELNKVSNSFDYIDFILPNVLNIDKNIQKNVLKGTYISRSNKTNYSNNRPNIVNYFTNNSITNNSLSLTKRSKIRTLQTR